MPAVRMPAGWRPPSPLERLRHARLVPPPATTMRRPSSRPARLGNPRWGLPGGWLGAPGPAYLPEVDALDLVAQRRAARLAAATVAPTIASAPTQVQPAPEPEPIGIRGLLGW